MGKTPQQTVYKVCSQRKGISCSAWVPTKIIPEDKNDPRYRYGLRYDLYKITRPHIKGHRLFAFNNLDDARAWARAIVRKPIIYRAVGYNAIVAPLEIPQFMSCYPEHIKVWWEKMPRTYEDIRVAMKDGRMQMAVSGTVLCTAIKPLEVV